MKTRSGFWFAILLVVALVTTSTTAFAKQDEVRRRMVGGHTFTPSLLIDFPMVVSYVGSFIGAGYAQIKFTDQNTGTSTKLRFAALGFGLGAGVAFTDYIGLHLGLGGSVLTGINADSALNIGAMFQLDVNAGPVFRFFKLGPVQMIGGVDIGFSLLNQINPASIVGAVAGTGSALIQSKGLDVRPYLGWAIGVGKVFGLQAGFDYKFNRNLTASANAHEIGVGLIGSLDFWVLGLNLGYRYGRDLTAKQHSHKIEAALFYSQKGNMSFGFALATEIPKGGQVQVIGQFALIYYWK